MAESFKGQEVAEERFREYSNSRKMRLDDMLEKLKPRKKERDGEKESSLYRNLKAKPKEP